MDATRSERVLTAALIIAIGVPLAVATDRPTLAAAAACVAIGAANAVYWWARGTPLREVYGR